ncbi:MAG: GYD domain-containing protein, partial [Anaerolineales bacterium]
MATYLMFGSYTIDSVQEISAQRTDKAEDLIKRFGGKLKAGYALLGEDDIVLIVELKDTERAMQASVALSKLLGIAFTTAPAVTLDEFDK